jgi:multidrug efflux pump subunit AcrA (membrane-fusion protein)
MGLRSGALALGALAVVGVAGCSTASATGTGVVNAPDKVVPVAGTSVSRVILSSQSANRLGIVTRRVSRLPGDGATVVPVSAVLYTQDGKTWIYTNPQPFNYIRQQVTLGPVDNDLWQLTSGPAPGTNVVTIGGAELLGAEQGVEGE